MTYADLAPLALADWCEENGRAEEAEFIRRPVPVEPKTDREEFHRQFGKYLDDLARIRCPFAWSRPVPQRHPGRTIAWVIETGDLLDPQSMSPGTVDVEQGFVVSLRVQRFTELRKHAADWFSTNPIRYVYITLFSDSGYEAVGGLLLVLQPPSPGRRPPPLPARRAVGPPAGELAGGEGPRPVRQPPLPRPGGRAFGPVRRRCPVRPGGGRAAGARGAAAHGGSEVIRSTLPQEIVLPAKRKKGRQSEESKVRYQQELKRFALQVAEIGSKHWISRSAPAAGATSSKSTGWPRATSTAPPS
jgi:hypothetical protein